MYMLIITSDNKYSFAQQFLKMFSGKWGKAMYSPLHISTCIHYKANVYTFHDSFYDKCPVICCQNIGTFTFINRGCRSQYKVSCHTKIPVSVLLGCLITNQFY